MSTKSKGKPKPKTAKKAKPEKKAKTLDLSKAEKPLSIHNKSMAVPLTDDEKNDVFEEAGHLSGELTALRNDKRAKNEEINAKIKKGEARLAILHGAMATKTLDKEIEIAEVPDWNRNRVIVVRTDTEEIIDERTMSADEKTRKPGKGKPPGKLMSLPSVTDTDKGKNGTFTNGAGDPPSDGEMETQDKAREAAEDGKPWEDDESTV